MTIMAPVVTIAFDQAAADETFFRIGDPLLGVIGTGILGGGPTAGIPTDVSCQGFAISVARGRSVELNEFAAGTCRVSLRNGDRAFDPSNEAGDFFGKLTPGKQIVVSICGVTVFRGRIDDWAQQYQPSIPSTVSVLAIDSLGQLARAEFDEWTTIEQLPGERINAVLDRSEVGFLDGRAVDPGVEVLQADSVSWGSNVLNYLQLVARSDQARLFARRDGVLRFQDRRGTAGISPILTFADDGSDLPFSGVFKRNAAELLYTSVSVDRANGLKQTVTNAAAKVSSGNRRLAVSGVLLNDDDRALALANWLLGIYSSDEDRIAGLVVRLAGYELADHMAVASLDIGDVVALRWTPEGVGDPLEKTLLIEGVQHQIDAAGVHVMTLSTSDALQRSPFRIGDPLLGVLGGPSRLAF